jgi:uncharacterized protein (DUF1697 family)
MNTFIALLKGINVGGHKKVPMIALRELLKELGYQDIQTYIQSGNVIFKTEERNIQKIEDTISTSVKKHFGFEVSVLVKTREDLKRIFEASPFPEEQKKASYFMMLNHKPEQVLIDKVSEKVYEGETYEIISDCIYYFYEKGLGQAKFNVNFFERKLNTFATARNYNTLVKLLYLSLEN